MFFARRPLPLDEATRVLADYLGAPVSPQSLGLAERGVAWQLCAERPVLAAVLVSGAQAQVLACAGETHPTPVIVGALDVTALVETVLVMLRAACGQELYAELVGAGR